MVHCNDPKYLNKSTMYSFKKNSCYKQWHRLPRLNVDKLIKKYKSRQNNFYNIVHK